MIKHELCPVCRKKGIALENKDNYTYPTMVYLCMNDTCSLKDGEVRVKWKVFFKPHEFETYYPHGEREAPRREKLDSGNGKKCIVPYCIQTAELLSTTCRNHRDFYKEEI